MKKLLLLTVGMLFSLALSAQKVAVKNNLAYDALLTPNLSLEFGLGKKTTLDIGGGYNWYDLGDHGNKKIKHWLVQPELRLWVCERFNGSFFGLHVHGGEFNMAGVELPFDILHTLKDHRYQGYFYGAGLSYGYQWILGKRWSLETTIGGGWARYDYEKFSYGKCGDKIKEDTKDYFGLTRLGISFMYFFR